MRISALVAFAIFPFLSTSAQQKQPPAPRPGERAIKYTATAGRMPIKDQAGATEAQVFFVAYTQDGADPAKRPLTFAFNGGPGSASIWLHMGALGPRKVALQKEGFMPEAPYRLMDNTQTPLDKTDLVLIDAIGTGFSRPADMKKAKKFWGLKGDAQAFGELIRLFLSRNQRWSSPLYLLGESYGSTRAAEVAGHLSDRGISFKGIILLSMALVMEGFYDLATPFAAADYTMSHLNVPLQFRKNISYSTYDSGHMVYLRADMLVKFHDDLAAFIGG